MSGHSKWANIKRKKEANDKVKGNVFSKLSRLITIAVLEGGGIADPENNVRLRLAVEKAHASNMPKENIKRAIEKGSGPDKSLMKEIVYEGFAPDGVSLIILAHTDNQNRTLGEIRNVLERHQGKLGNMGSVAYLFQKCGLIVLDKNVVGENKILELSDNFEALDITDDESKYFLYIPYEKLGHIKELLGNIDYVSAEIDFKPQSPIMIEDEKKLEKIAQLVEALEELEDVQKVFTNLN
ncbi:YebC/PmpR family DNA-binding transcriptional regulator [Patescibacteria group bacterium]|nr:YebC/PmpR family DNA-binding transcriptional regulator [Patescibacteria group bacterium]